MEIILASIAGVDEKFFEIVWENFPNAGFALFCVGAIAFVSFKIFAFFMGLKNGFADVIRTVESMKTMIADSNKRIDDEKRDNKEKFTAVEIRQSAVEVSIIKLDGKIEKVDQKVDTLRNEMNIHFEYVHERFEDVNRRFDKIDVRFERLEEKMDKKFDIIINLLLEKRDDTVISQLRKSQ